MADLAVTLLWGVAWLSLALGAVLLLLLVWTLMEEATIV